jgi:hypothetical protein
MKPYQTDAPFHTISAPSSIPSEWIGYIPKRLSVLVDCLHHGFWRILLSAIQRFQ